MIFDDANPNAKRKTIPNNSASATSRHKSEIIFHTPELLSPVPNPSSNTNLTLKSEIIFPTTELRSPEELMVLKRGFPVPIPLDNPDLNMDVPNPNLNPSPNPGSDLNTIQAYLATNPEGGGGGGGGVPQGAVDVLVGDPQSDLCDTETNITDFVNALPEFLIENEDENKNNEELKTEITDIESIFIPDLICNASSNANALTSNASSSSSAKASSSSSSSSSAKASPSNTVQPDCIKAISLRKSTSMISTKCHGLRLTVDTSITTLLNNIFPNNKAEVDKWLDVIRKSLHCMYLIGGFPGMSTMSSPNLNSEGHREAMHISFLTIAAITLADYRKGVYSLMANLDILCNRYFLSLENILVHSYKANVDMYNPTEAAGLKAAESNGPITTERHPVNRNAIGHFSFSCYTDKVYNWFKQILNTTISVGYTDLKLEVKKAMSTGDAFSTIGSGGATQPGDKTTGRPPLAFILEIGKDGVNYSDISSFNNAVNYEPFYQENDSKLSNSSWKGMISSVISNLMSYAYLTSNPLKLFRTLVEGNIEFLKGTTLKMIRQWNSVFGNEHYLKVQHFEVVDDRNPFSNVKIDTAYQIGMSSDKYKIIKKAYTCGVGGGMAHIPNLDDQIKHDIEYKIAFAPSLFFYLIDCMFTYLMLKLIDEFRKNNNLNSIQIKKLQTDINKIFCTDTFLVLEWCVKNHRSINEDYSCQIAPFESPRQLENASYNERDNQTYTQEESWTVYPQAYLNNNNEEQLKKVASVRKDSGIVNPAGGRMIRNKSSLRNRVTRKRQKQQNKQRRKTKRRITRRTTRKRQRQGKRRRTKKRN